MMTMTVRPPLKVEKIRRGIAQGQAKKGKGKRAMTMAMKHPQKRSNFAPVCCVALVMALVPLRAARTRTPRSRVYCFFWVVFLGGKREISNAP